MAAWQKDRSACKYLLLKTIYDISDVDVVERSRYDMSFKYFLGMTPEETDLINPSSLSKFCKLRLRDKDLLDLLIGKTVGIAMEKGDYKVTHDNSRCHPHRLPQQSVVTHGDSKIAFETVAQEHP